MYRLWAWSLIVTIPVTAMFVVWLLAVSERYQVLGVRLDVQGGESNLLHPIMKYEWYRTQRRLGLALSSGDRNSGLETVELWLSKSGENELNSDLPRSGREYAKGKITLPDRSFGKVSLRYRGDMMHHWALAKKSWRVKTKKKSLWKGLRKFNLIVPETWAILEEHFGYRIAKDLGLLAPVSEIVNLRVDGANRGVHTLVGQVDELFLRQNERMPGDLFVGDLLLGDALPGFENKVFDLPGMWTKAAINNHFADEHAASIFRLCEVLDWAPGPAKAKALGNILDMQAMGRFAAYRSLVQTGHVDSYHNWKLYYDPWRNRFEPVVWDPNAWGLGWAPTPEHAAFEWPLFSEFDRVLVHDHRYRWAQHKALVEFFNAAQGEAILKDMETMGARVVLAAEVDPALAFSILPSSVERVAGGVQALRSRANGYMQAFRERHLDASAQIVRGPMLAAGPGQWTVPVTLEGWKPVAGVRLHFARPVPDGAQFYWGVQDSGGWAEVEAHVTRVGDTVAIDQPLLPGVHIEPMKRGHSFSHTSSPRPLTYRLRMHLPGRESLDLRDFVSLDLDGVGSTIALSDTTFVGALEGDFAALFQAGVVPVTTWSGPKTLQGLTEIFGDLILEKGTTLSMGESASVIVHGRLQAVGTAQEPIRIGPAVVGQEPWGTFAIRTHKADGSVLEQVHFEGGSGYMDGLQEYSAMFSAHDVDGLRIRGCSFEQGLVVDDMVHVVYGQDLQIEDCRFSGALSDALDLDGCQGLISKCQFEGSGNDAIDLMMSQIEVRDTVLERSGDKGVSVGEGSRLLWSGGRVETCGIGIQVKDGSLALIRGAVFSSNRQALHAYKKNWQYGNGGHGLVQDCEFQSNEVFADADKHSSWHFAGSRIPELDGMSSRLHAVDDFGEDLPGNVRLQFETSQLLKAALQF